MNSRDMTGEWVDDMVGRVLGKKMQFDVLTIQLFEELLDLFAVNGSDQAVADQLYPADPNRLQRWLEHRSALLEAKNAIDAMDMSKLRRVANFSQARMG